MYRFCVTLKRRSKPTVTTNRQAFQKKLFDLPNSEKWFKFNAYEFLTKIRKKITMMINEVKYYIRYLVNDYINNKKKKLFICEITIYIYI